MKRLAVAIARDRPDLPDVAEIRRHAAHGLAILHRAAPADAVAPGLETLQEYASTVALLHARETVLPLRFGSLHESENDLDDWLRIHADDWRAGLDQVEGCVEMGVRILLDPPSPSAQPRRSIAADRPGTAYLESLRARHDDLDACLETARSATGRLHEVLAGTYRRSTVEEPARGRERLLSLAYLVPRESLERFVEALGPPTAWPVGKLLLTGPWPPYGFAVVNHEK